MDERETIFSKPRINDKFQKGKIPHLKKNSKFTCLMENWWQRYPVIWKVLNFVILTLIDKRVTIKTRECVRKVRISTKIKFQNTHN